MGSDRPGTEFLRSSQEVKELKIPGGKMKSKPSKLKPLEGAKKKKEKVRNMVDDMDYEEEMGHCCSLVVMMRLRCQTVLKGTPS